MPMTKKELARYEEALTASALRTTGDVSPDVPPPAHSFDGALTKGWAIVGARSDYARVDVACSSSVYHAVGRTDQTTTQEPIWLYSTKLLALKALRRVLEKQAAAMLRRIDKQVEEETVHPTQCPANRS